MKVPIRKEYFDKIGVDKVIEYRDAHFTFICEDTGRQKRINIEACKVMPTKDVPKEYQGKGMFEDDHVVCFLLEKSEETEKKKMINCNVCKNQDNGDKCMVCIAGSNFKEDIDTFSDNHY